MESAVKSQMAYGDPVQGFQDKDIICTNKWSITVQIPLSELR